MPRRGKASGDWRREQVAPAAPTRSIPGDAVRGDESSGEVVIRDATAADWSGVARLLAELRRPDVRGSGFEQRAVDLYESYLAREDTRAVVADSKDSVGDVVGFANVEYRRRLNYRTEQGWVAEVIVAQGRRGQGIGVALLGALENDARRRGAWGLALESAMWRTDAHRFYLGQGWSQSSLAFTKTLDPQRVP